MKKLLTILGLVISVASFSQITISAALPSNINAGSSIDAEVKINKGTVGNFAKYQMDVPTGYIVSAIDVKGGNYTFENQRAKIVWVSVPIETEFTLKLKIQANSDAANGTFSQKFYYLENNEKKEVEGNSTLVTVGGGSDVAATTHVETVASSTPTETKPVETTNTTPVETVKSTPVETIASSTPVETVKSTPVETVKATPVETKTAPVAKTASTETAGMTFKVQLGAYSTQPNKSKFAGISNVSIEQINGFYKVTCGSFKTKEDAIKYRDELQSKGFNGFIVKYQNGQRLN